MRTRKTNSNDRATYKYTSCVRNEDGSYSEETIEIKPGENGVTEADREVYYNNKNLRPGRTVEEKAEIKAWKEKYIKSFEERHGYKPNKDDVDYAAHKRYGRAWQKVRDSYVKEHPFCELCFKKELMVAVEEVHHIKPLSEGGTHEKNNLISLCKSCHSRIHASVEISGITTSALGCD